MREKRFQASNFGVGADLDVYDAVAHALRTQLSAMFESIDFAEEADGADTGDVLVRFDYGSVETYRDSDRAILRFRMDFLVGFVDAQTNRGIGTYLHEERVAYKPPVEAQVATYLTVSSLEEGGPPPAQPESRTRTGTVAEPMAV
ncbi:MAG TPA: hypothetical protein VIY27_02340 [Myxococcota bacterium]